MKQYTFVLNFGYVESSSLSYFPFSSLNKYRSAKEALVDLSLFLKEQYLSRHTIEPKKCCLASKEKDSGAEFCAKCGKSLLKEAFNDEWFIDWLQDMSNCDVDRFHGDFIDYDTSHRW